MAWSDANQWAKPSVLQSPPGVQAPQNSINLTPSTGEVHAPGAAAPVDKMNLSLVPQSAGVPDAAPAAPMPPAQGAPDPAASPQAAAPQTFTMGADAAKPSIEEQVRDLLAMIANSPADFDLGTGSDMVYGGNSSPASVGVGAGVGGGGSGAFTEEQLAAIVQSLLKMDEPTRQQELAALERDDRNEIRARLEEIRASGSSAAPEGRVADAVKRIQANPAIKSELLSKLTPEEKAQVEQALTPAPAQGPAAPQAPTVAASEVPEAIQPNAPAAATEAPAATEPAGRKPYEGLPQETINALREPTFKLTHPEITEAQIASMTPEQATELLKPKKNKVGAPQALPNGGSRVFYDDNSYEDLPPPAGGERNANPFQIHNFPDGSVGVLDPSNGQITKLSGINKWTPVTTRRGAIYAVSTDDTGNLITKNILGPEDVASPAVGPRGQHGSMTETGTFKPFDADEQPAGVLQNGTGISRLLDPYSGDVKAQYTNPFSADGVTYTPKDMNVDKSDLDRFRKFDWLGIGEDDADGAIGDSTAGAAPSDNAIGGGPSWSDNSWSAPFSSMPNGDPLGSTVGVGADPLQVPPSGQSMPTSLPGTPMPGTARGPMPQGGGQAPQPAAQPEQAPPEPPSSLVGSSLNKNLGWKTPNWSPKTWAGDPGIGLGADVSNEWDKHLTENPDLRDNPAVLPGPVGNPVDESPTGPMMTKDLLHGLVDPTTGMDRLNTDMGQEAPVVSSTPMAQGGGPITLSTPLEQIGGMRMATPLEPMGGTRTTTPMAQEAPTMLNTDFSDPHPIPWNPPDLNAAGRTPRVVGDETGPQREPRIAPHQDFDNMSQGMDVPASRGPNVVEADPMSRDKRTGTQSNDAAEIEALVRRMQEGIAPNPDLGMDRAPSRWINPEGYEDPTKDSMPGQEPSKPASTWAPGATERWGGGGTTPVDGDARPKMLEDYASKYRGAPAAGPIAEPEPQRNGVQSLLHRFGIGSDGAGDPEQDQSMSTAEPDKQWDEFIMTPKGQEFLQKFFGDSTEPTQLQLGKGADYVPPVPPQSVVGDGNKWMQDVPMEGKHKGTDLQAYSGTPIQSPVNGVVVKVMEKPEGLGLQVYVLDPTTGEVHIMSHDRSVAVKEGDHVEAGQVIASVGESGAGATGPHLDYRIQDAATGAYKNPEPRLGALAKMPMAPNTVGAGEDGDDDHSGDVESGVVEGGASAGESGGQTEPTAAEVVPSGETITLDAPIEEVKDAPLTFTPENNYGGFGPASSFIGGAQDVRSGGASKNGESERLAWALDQLGYTPESWQAEKDRQAGINNGTRDDYGNLIAGGGNGHPLDNGISLAPVKPKSASAPSAARPAASATTASASLRPPTITPLRPEQQPGLMRPWSPTLNWRDYAGLRKLGLGEEGDDVEPTPAPEPDPTPVPEPEPTPTPEPTPSPVPDPIQTPPITTPPITTPKPVTTPVKAVAPVTDWNALVGPQLDLQKAQLKQSWEEFLKNYGLNEAQVSGVLNGQPTLAKQQLDQAWNMFSRQMDTTVSEAEKQRQLQTDLYGTYQQKRQAQLTDKALQNPWLAALGGMAPAWNEVGGPGMISAQAMQAIGGQNGGGGATTGPAMTGPLKADDISALYQKYMGTPPPAQHLQDMLASGIDRSKLLTALNAWTNGAVTASGEMPVGTGADEADPTMTAGMGMNEQTGQPTTTPPAGNGAPAPSGSTAAPAPSATNSDPGDSAVDSGGMGMNESAPVPVSQGGPDPHPEWRGGPSTYKPEGYTSPPITGGPANTPQSQTMPQQDFINWVKDSWKNSGNAAFVNASNTMNDADFLAFVAKNDPDRGKMAQGYMNAPNPVDSGGMGMNENTGLLPNEGSGLRTMTPEEQANVARGLQPNGSSWDEPDHPISIPERPDKGMSRDTFINWVKDSWQGSGNQSHINAGNTMNDDDFLRYVAANDPDRGKQAAALLNAPPTTDPWTGGPGGGAFYANAPQEDVQTGPGMTGSAPVAEGPNGTGPARTTPETSLNSFNDSMTKGTEPTWRDFNSWNPYEKTAFRTKIESQGTPWETESVILRNKWGTEGGPTATPSQTRLQGVTNTPEQRINQEFNANTFGEPSANYWSRMGRSWATANSPQIAVKA